VAHRLANAGRGQKVSDRTFRWLTTRFGSYKLQLR
jgi:hypothetical protein